MDKWKESEVAKMKVGGNRNARDFLDEHDDWNHSAPITQKYNSRAAALYRDKILVESQGGQWSEATSQARNHKPTGMAALASSSSSKGTSKMSSSQSFSGFGGNNDHGSSYQNGGGGGVNFNSSEFKAQKEDFFSRKQQENAGRRDDLPPSQGGKYSGFGNTVEPPPRSYSTNDFYDNTLGGLTTVS